MAAPLGGPIDQTVAIAEARLRAEVGTGRHGHSGGSAKLACPVCARNAEREAPRVPAEGRSGRKPSARASVRNHFCTKRWPRGGEHVLFYAMARRPRALKATPARSTWPSPTNRS